MVKAQELIKSGTARKFLEPANIGTLAYMHQLKQSHMFCIHWKHLWLMTFQWLHPHCIHAFQGFYGSEKKQGKLKKEDSVYKMPVLLQYFFLQFECIKKLPNGISGWRASMMETNALLAKWIGKQKTNGFKWIVNQISRSSHWHINKSIKNMVRKETVRVWVSKTYSYFIIIFHKYQCHHQFLKLTIPAFKIFKTSTWWELISLSRHSNVPAIQPDNSPKANSASSLSPRLTSSDLLKKIIWNGILFALSIYRAEKFDVTNII